VTTNDGETTGHSNGSRQHFRSVAVPRLPATRRRRSMSHIERFALQCHVISARMFANYPVLWKLAVAKNEHRSTRYMLW